MFCDNCGRSIPDNSQSCSFCGQVFAKAAAAASPLSTGGTPRSATVNPSGPSGWSSIVLGPSRKVLEAVERGVVIRAAVAVALRVLAVLFVIGGILLLIQLLKFSFNLPTAQGTAGGLILTLLLLGAIAASCQVLLYRAESVSALGESPFTVIPIVSILLRAMGELYAVAGIAVGVGGCLFVWFSGESPLGMLGGIAPFLPSVPAGGTFLDGVVLLAWAGLGSFALLLIFYFLAEAIVVMADIARNVRPLVKAGGTKGS